MTTPNDDPLAPILAEIRAERARQDAKWGVQNHPSEDPTGWWAGKDTSDAMARRCGEVEIPTPDRARFLCSVNADRGTLTWAHILVEEVSEAVEMGHDPAACYAELVQVASVVVAWMECLRRQGVTP